MDDQRRPGDVPGEGFGPVPGDAAGPWRLSGGEHGNVLYDADGAVLARDWRVTPRNFLGRTFTVSSPTVEWEGRAVGLTVAQVALSGPGGELSLNRRVGERGRDVVDVEHRALVARVKIHRGSPTVQIVGGSPEVAEVDPELLAAAVFACEHLDGDARLLG